KLLGLPYPGGAKLSELAESGRPEAFVFPRPMIHSDDLQMSFSGLKTAVLTAVEKVREANGSETIPEQTRNNICRAFQDAVVEVLEAKVKKALLQTGFRTVVVAGGVGANRKLRETFGNMTVQIPTPKGKPKHPSEKVSVFFPPMAYCTDNGAMIAFAGAMHLGKGREVGAFNVRPRWSLSEIVK
ncbi:TPA: tRNA (adenosine(37)-N6)-threonylcarbamoyltransferase complex transferase subunit TsaD, partial [Neisseria gonorrhoeae]